MLIGWSLPYEMGEKCIMMCFNKSLEPCLCVQELSSQVMCGPLSHNEVFTSFTVG